MNAIEYFAMKFRRSSNRRTSMAITSTSALAVTACGGGSGGTEIPVRINSYVAPSSNYVSPDETDPNFEILKKIYNEPYWVITKWINGMIIYHR